MTAPATTPPKAMPRLRTLVAMSLLSFLGAAQPQPRAAEGETVTRYFLSSSALHKQRTGKAVYLYDEITQTEALQHAHERAYFVGHFKDGQLRAYQKMFRGEVLMDVDEAALAAQNQNARK